MDRTCAYGKKPSVEVQNVSNDKISVIISSSTKDAISYVPPTVFISLKDLKGGFSFKAHFQNTNKRCKADHD